MALIRLSKAQIAAANKSREAALRKYPDFRLQDEKQQRVIKEKVATLSSNQERPS